MRLSSVRSAAAHYRIVVLGGGTGGCAASHRFRNLAPRGQLAVIEPNELHYYQPGFTLVGGGLKTLSECVRPMQSVLHPENVWIRKEAVEINPKDCSIILSDGSEIKYDLLIVAAGLQLRYDLVEGLPEALSAPGVISVYRSDLVEKAQRDIASFRGGNALFTLPNTPVKCAGGGQKVCYLADEVFRKNGVRSRSSLVYNTNLNDVFDVPKYAVALNKVLKAKNIGLNVRRNLKKVDAGRREAVFELLNTSAQPTGETEVQKFDLLHAVPPCSPIKVLRECAALTNANGWIDANAQTLQSTRFDNVFGIGDCLGTPNKKTAAAIYSQMRALSSNIPAFLQGKELRGKYFGYSSCPLIVSSNRVILAEFTPSGPYETFPFDQSIPSYTAYLMKRYFLPQLYWRFALSGHWLGPANVRKLLHLGLV